MKKRIILTLMLVFSVVMVACSSNKKEETKKESKKEVVESKAESKEESKEETKKESKSEVSENKESELEVLALSENIVVGGEKKGNKKDVYKFTTKNPLRIGHKYEFKQDLSKISDNTINAPEAMMLGKPIGYAISKDNLEKIKKNVSDLVFVDAREADEFSKKTVENAINIPESTVKAEPNEELLKTINPDKVHVIFGKPEKAASVANWLYKNAKVKVTLTIDEAEILN